VPETCLRCRVGVDVEGLGIVFLEAAACGLPVVAGDSGGAPDAVVDGDTGCVVDGRSQDAVAAAVTDLLADRDKAAAMGARGRAWVQQEWSWEHAAATLQQLLQA
jgi:phosphatidylinositol alpha-1,6-mannosyltransferase